MSSSNQAPPLPPGYPNDLTYKFNASMAIIVVVLVTTFFFMALFVLYVRRCNLASVANLDWASRANQQQQQQNPQQQNRSHGLDPEVMSKLPILRYASIKSSKKGKAGSDCAVCLLPFEEEDEVRVLPPCGHGFHAECIDLWLETHSTCPLCRRDLGSSNQEAAAGGNLQRALSAVIFSLRRDPNSSSLAEGRPDPHSVSPDLDLEQGGEAGGVHDPQQQQDLATRALSKNSESFKMAEHELDLMEVREKLLAKSRRFQSSRSMRFNLMPPHQEHISQDLSPDGGLPLRRSVSDGEALKTWAASAAQSSSSSRDDTSVLFPAFARRSLKWLVGGRKDPEQDAVQ